MDGRRCSDEGQVPTGPGIRRSSPLQPVLAAELGGWSRRADPPQSPLQRGSRLDSRGVGGRQFCIQREADDVPPPALAGVRVGHLWAYLPLSEVFISAKKTWIVHGLTPVCCPDRVLGASKKQSGRCIEGE